MRNHRSEIRIRLIPFRRGVLLVDVEGLISILCGFSNDRGGKPREQDRKGGRHVLAVLPQDRRIIMRPKSFPSATVCPHSS